MPVAVAVLVAALVATMVWPSPVAAAPTSVEQHVATMVNDFRIAHGRPPLPLHAGMTDDARAWSAHMAATGVAHDPNYRRSCDRFPGRGVCFENVGAASGADQVQRMMEGSSTHRANLLCDCTHIGVGVVVRDGVAWLTQRLVHDGRSSVPPMRESMSTEEVTAARRYASSAYGDVLGRAPSSGELDHWTTRVASPVQRKLFATALGYSDEWVGAVVDSYYQIALGRPADPEGRRYWIDVIRRRRLAPADVASSFYASDEYFDRRGRDIGAWVDDLYRELLSRTADAGGREHWTNVARTYGRPPVSSNVYDSTESLRRRVDSLYQHFLGRAADAEGRDHWSRILDRSGNDVDLAVTLVASTEYFARAQG